MIHQTEIMQFKKGDLVDHFLLLRKAEQRITKANKQFISLELGDASGVIPANIWENVDEISKITKAGEVVKVEGSIEDYQGNLQLRINKIRLPKLSEKISSIDFLPKSKRNLKEMQNEFTQRIEKIKNPFLKSLLKIMFNEKDYDTYCKVPAGKSWHHSYLHGLIEHSLELIRICDLMADIHPELNRDLLICAAMLHDYGKIEELTIEPSFDYTDKGRLLGHIVIAANLVEIRSGEITGFPEELKTQLLHILLSHQGKLEHASPVVPKTIEAITLYHADELSAKVNAYKLAIQSEKNSGSRWTKYLPLIETPIYMIDANEESNSSSQKTLFNLK